MMSPLAKFSVGALAVAALGCGGKAATGTTEPTGGTPVKIKRVTLSFTSTDATPMGATAKKSAVYLQLIDENGQTVSHQLGTFEGTCAAAVPSASVLAAMRCWAGDHGADLGVTSVLHTWTRDLRFHPHVHCIVTGGGLSLDAQRWVAAPVHYLFPVRALGESWPPFAFYAKPSKDFVARLRAIARSMAANRLLAPADALHARRHPARLAPPVAPRREQRARLASGGVPEIPLEPPAVDDRLELPQDAEDLPRRVASEPALHADHRPFEIVRAVRLLRRRPGCRPGAGEPSRRREEARRSRRREEARPEEHRNRRREARRSRRRGALPGEGHRNRRRGARRPEELHQEGDPSRRRRPVHRHHNRLACESPFTAGGRRAALRSRARLFDPRSGGNFLCHCRERKSVARTGREDHAVRHEILREQAGFQVADDQTR